MGMKITKLRPVGGFCAETAAAISILSAALASIPVSTTHTIAGGIMGVGSVQRFTAVHWGVARTIIWAWILTIAISGAFAALCFWLLHHWPRNPRPGYEPPLGRQPKIVVSDPDREPPRSSA